MRRRRWTLLAPAAALLAATAGCTADDVSPGDAARSAPATPAAGGRLVAELRQSSRDAALGRIQVWVENETPAEVVPTRLTYRDPRLRRPLDGGRLRPVPSGAGRGYTLDLPTRPRCARRSGSGVLEVRYAGRSATVAADDPADVLRTWARSRCLELEVAQVATLQWADRVADGAVDRGDTGMLTLLAEPTGATGRRLVLETVGGTPILSPADGAAAWSPGTVVPGDGRPTQVALPVRPARCDGHAFLEAGGATAFRVHLTLLGPGSRRSEGDVVLRMGPRGAAAAIAYAVAACGLG